MVWGDRRRRRSENGNGISRVSRHALQQIREDPLIDLPPRFHGQIQKTDPALPRGARPTYQPVGLHAQPRHSQLEAHPDALLLAQRRDGLYGRTLAVEIADDAAVGRVQRYIGQRAQLMPIVSACLPRGKRYDLHTIRQKCAGRALLVQILVSGTRRPTVTGLVRKNAQSPRQSISVPSASSACRSHAGSWDPSQQISRSSGSQAPFAPQPYRLHPGCHIRSRT